MTEPLATYTTHPPDPAGAVSQLPPSDAEIAAAARSAAATIDIVIRHWGYSQWASIEPLRRLLALVTNPAPEEPLIFAAPCSRQS